VRSTRKIACRISSRSLCGLKEGRTISKQQLELPDYGRLGYQIYGAGERTVLLLHGLVGSSWLGDSWISAIVENKVRCIVPERPGYGDSSAIELRSVADWMPIIRAFVQKLELNAADVIGCSAGGPYAYATALALPDVIKTVYILDGVPAVYEARVLRHYSERDKAAYKDFSEQPQSAVQRYYVQQMEAAKKRLENTDLGYVKNALDEVLAQRCFGVAQESRLQILPWELPLADLEQKVVLFHARADEMVPYEAAKEMPGFLTNCEFRDLELPTLAPGESAHMTAISEAFCRILAGT